MSEIRPLTKRQFDAYCYAYCYVRAPFIRIGWQELAWYEAYDRRLIGVVALELTDNDYGYVILGRDKTKVFRAIGISPTFIPVWRKQETG